MRLLNTTSFRLEEFIGEHKPEYAILSHTWGDGEVLFQDIQNQQDSAWKQKRGFEKVEGSCHRAKLDGYEYIWIDTCCIDKRSSAELSEAINSMFAWYESANVCYAFLEDVQDQAGLPTSRWFTRGWTLQELIAPHDVQFYNKNWEFLGDRYMLSPQIAEQTGIDLDVLTFNHTVNNEPWEEHMDSDFPNQCASCGVSFKSIGSIFKNYCVAQKMRWASSRQTTREEDMAYCLLGIFDVHMVLIYGEGLIEAFRRLQEEILKRSDDHSILAYYPWPGHRNIRNGILATIPQQFKLGVDYVRPMWSHFRQAKPKMELAPGRLTLTVTLCPAPLGLPGKDLWIAILDCVMGNDLRSRPAILLEKLYEGEVLCYRSIHKSIFSIEPPDRIRIIGPLGSFPKNSYMGTINLQRASRETISIVSAMDFVNSDPDYPPVYWQSQISKFNQHNMDNLQYSIVDTIPRWIDSRHLTLPAETTIIIAFENQLSTFFLIWVNDDSNIRYTLVSLYDLRYHLHIHGVYEYSKATDSCKATDIMTLLKTQWMNLSRIVSFLLHKMTNSSLIIEGLYTHRFEVSVGIRDTIFLNTRVRDVEVDIRRY